MDLDQLEQIVIRDLDEYVYEVPEGTVGTAWSNERVRSQLDLMRRSLISPYLVDVVMEQPFELLSTSEFKTRRCAVVADPNDGYLLIFDFATNEFLLAQFADDSIHSIGVRGDAVGCFMAR